MATSKIDLAKYAHLTTKSAKIRSMDRDGHSRYAISVALHIRYQHVRNVLITPVTTPKESFIHVMTDADL